MKLGLEWGQSSKRGATDQKIENKVERSSKMLCETNSVEVDIQTLSNLESLIVSIHVMVVNSVKCCYNEFNQTLIYAFTSCLLSIL